MKLLKITLLSWLLCLFSVLWADDEILPAKAVFIPSVTSVSDSEIIINIAIKPGYYLYRQRLFSLTAVDDALSIEHVDLSAGKDKTDEFFGTQSVWHGGNHQAQITVRYENPSALKNARLKLKYQGCQEGVICYPPQTVILPVTLPQADTGSGLNADFLKEKMPQSSPFFRQGKKQLLPEDQAFDLSLEPIDATTWALRWRIAEDYYLYRDKIRVVSTNLANVQLSEGQKHSDEFFGVQTVYRHQQGLANLYFKQPMESFELAVEYQGCADQGVCYPVMRRQLSVVDGKVKAVNNIAQLPSNLDSQKLSSNPVVKSAGKSAGKVNNASRVIERLTTALKDNLLLGMGLLLVAGLALSFTPCVLPMLPILLGIITNQNQVSKVRAAVLSSAYALGVAVMMAVFGLVVAKTGINLQIIFQQPLWLIIFAAIFILMGLAMLGVFSIAMPNKVQNKVFTWQNRFKDATPSNLFVVGALSTLVVGPCIAPPLIAILAFIATTGDSLKGALYLFALGLGMSLPLVIFATLVSHVPKTGAFSRLVTRLFALLMFGVGLWLLARLLPGYVSLVLWGIFMLVVGWLFWRSGLTASVAKMIARGIALLALLLGMAWTVGGVMGNSNPLKPLTKITHLPFKAINTEDELQVEINRSKQPVILDLYADWCVSCQEIEHITFTNKKVIEQLKDFTRLKLDITPVTATHRQLLKTLDLVGPPALLFFKKGEEIVNERHIGVIHAKELEEKLLNIKMIK